MLLCACDRQVETNPDVVQISDPRIKTVEHVTEYLESATLTGALEVIVNGHMWRFHTPFHANINVQLGAPASNSFEIHETTTEKEIREWLEKNKTNWIRYVPSRRSNVKFLWWVLDAMEEEAMPYGLVEPSDNREIVGRLEAVVPAKEGSQPGEVVNASSAAGNSENRLDD